MKHLKLTMLCLAVLVSASSALAAGPNTTSYQGRLTDAVGDPVTDGVYSCDFHMYNTEVGGVAVWSELAVPVTTVNGLFNAELGASNPFPTIFAGNQLGTSIFTAYDSLWLEIVVDGETITPRTFFHSTPFAHSARNIDSRGHGFDSAALYTQSENAGIFGLGTDGLDQWRLWGESWGELLLHNNSVSNDLTVYLTSVGDFGGGALHLRKNDGSASIQLHGGETSDGSVILPDSAINADEMLNEPGVAFARNSGIGTLTNSGTSQDFETVTITIPTNGYIVIAGNAYSQFRGTTGGLYGWAQIDETAGGGTLSQGAGFQWTGGNGQANGSGNWSYDDVTLRRVYFKASGTYTFRIEGNAYSGNSPGAEVLNLGNWLQATFYPTSYGPVATIASTPGDAPNSKTVTSIDPMTNFETTVYEIDLRYLELQAKKARIKVKDAQIEALKAERTLQDAKQKQGSK